MEFMTTKPEFTLIKSKIYELRGVKIMFDFDLAEIYHVETKYLKRAVRNNIERFPKDFMFELTQNELHSLRCKICTLENGGRGQHVKYMPFAFTEQGVAQLSSVLHSSFAIEVNITIIRTFVALRQYALGYAELNFKLEDFMQKTNTHISEIYELLDEFAAQKKEPEKPPTRIGFVLR
jgi:hypothetical protein